ncbi:MAG: STAS domain-containing protein, partial [Candidatus Competibacteraceae bacterium]|nr:STAS domain-containing protein [Candidatus Competibacteraceae bacterium]
MHNQNETGNQAFQANETGDSQTIAIPKELTVVEAVPFRNAFRSICEANNPPFKVVLDFSKTSFINSSGIGALASSIKMSKTSDITLTIMGLNAQVQAVLTMTGLDKVLPIEADETGEIREEPIDETALPVTHPSIRSRAKRIIDILGALVGLFITAILFIPIAIAIKRDSPGPLFFSQTRCGWMGK